MSIWLQSRFTAFCRKWKLKHKCSSLPTHIYVSYMYVPMLNNESISHFDSSLFNAVIVTSIVSNSSPSSSSILYRSSSSNAHNVTPLSSSSSSGSGDGVLIRHFNLAIPLLAGWTCQTWIIHYLDSDSHVWLKFVQEFFYKPSRVYLEYTWNFVPFYDGCSIKSALIKCATTG